MLFEPTTQPDSQLLLTHLAPALAKGRLDEALTLVRKNWTVAQLVEMLGQRSQRVDIRKMAAIALGLVGDRRAITPLAVALHDSDDMIAEMAEHALWSIWFRLGNDVAVCLLKRGSCHLNHGNFDMAVDNFSEAITEDPSFAEVYNQRAMAQYLAERYPEAIRDCQETLARMPQHFGAMSGMGHANASLKRWAEARHCYRLALAIHPRLDGIKTALRQVDEILAGSSPGLADPSPPPACAPPPPPPSTRGSATK